ncbi:MAG: hypothetical protein HOO67_04805 [Candidatus Peribacteraceae bacterium]|nr:hypothetical protein [Candidatus Peribacteraceae bacterium]
MISRATIALLVCLLVLFGVSAWGGYAYRARQARTEQYEQPGWCCMLKKRECVIADSLDACEGKGGASFNWDRSACDSSCRPPVRRVEQKKAAVPPAQNSVAP